MDKVSSLSGNRRIREEAREWVVVFNRDEAPSRQTIRDLQAWVERSPIHAAELRRAEARWQETNQLTELAIPLCRSCHHEEAAEARGWSDVLFGVKWPAPAAAFASLLLVSFLALSLYFPNSSVGNGVYGTAVGELRLLTLRDGSVVHLDTNSQAKIHFDGRARRIELLQGKAHFEVMKDKSRPFEVFAGEGLVRAVGTAFSVHLNTSGSVEVLVDEGRVDLARLERLENQPADPGFGQADELDAVPAAETAQRTFGSLKSGQGVLFSAREEAFAEFAEKELQRAQSWREGTLIFLGEPLKNVVSKISRYTPAKIEIVDPALGELEVGGRFKIGDIAALFDVLENGFNVRVVQVSENHYQLRLAQ